MKTLIIRSYSKSETQGTLFVFDERDILFRGVSLELADNGNQRNVSCIPEGKYWIIKWWTPSKGYCFLIQDVPERDNILIHKGNFVNGKKIDSKGCILPGMRFMDINEDGFIDVLESTKALDKLYELLPERSELHII